VTVTVAEPVYVRDRIAIPAGTTMTGRVAALRRPTASGRLRDAGGGDFTSHDVAVLRFDTLTLAGGIEKPIVTTVDAGRDHAAATAGQWLKEYVLGQLPTHRRYMHAGADYTVTLVEPLILRGGALPAADTQPRAIVRLLTPIDSSRAQPGTPVRVVVDRPFVDRRGAAIVEGTTLDGTITRVTRAGTLHRQGRVEIAIDGMRAVATIADSKWRFALPVLALGALAGAPDGDRGHLANFLGRGGAGWSGFEMIGGAIAQASAPLAIGFGSWGVARGLWINVFSKGHDVVVPANTLLVLTAS